MAHARRRQIDDLFQRLLDFSPIVGVFGHRQVGKSTFLASVASNYHTLDDIDTLEHAHGNPKQFVSNPSSNPMVIDECQLEPKLFPTLKEYVRTRKKPGQFVLSGSVRFTSKLAIRESLAGRMALVEMLPFSVSEILGEPLSESVLKIFYYKSLANDSLRVLHPLNKLKYFSKHFQTFLENGGLPGLCFIRSPQLQRSALGELHDLILSRDMITVSGVRTPVATLKRLLAYIAKNGIEPYVASDVTRTLGLAAQTQKSILAAFEAMFLIRRISVIGGKRDCFLLEDQLEERIYAGDDLSFTKKLETAVYRNVRTQFMYRLDKGAQFETYLTRDHARVPIVIRDQDHALGLIVLHDDSPSLSELRSGASFLKNHARAKIIYLSPGIIAPRIMDERSLCCSIAAIL